MDGKLEGSTLANDYASIFLNSALYQNPIAALSLLFLFFARFMPIIALSPFFGSRVLPHPVKVTFALSMFVIFLPKLIQNTTIALDFNLLLLVFMVKELLVGLLIGNLMSIPFVIVQSAGIIIDHQRGGSSLMVNDPTIQNQSSPLGTLFNMVLIYIFFAMDGPFMFLEVISSSYDYLPPDQFMNSQFFAIDSPSWHLLAKLFNDVMVFSIQFATPALIAILMTDSFLGIANRLAPQVQITFLGMPLKSLLGLYVIYEGWLLMVKQMRITSIDWLQHTEEMVRYFKLIGE